MGDAYEAQRKRLDRLMADPDKPVFIPVRRDPKAFPDAPEFVRNIMGSSAGAGSGEFHVYRHLRRKEYARQKFIDDLGKKEEKDVQYQEKLKKHQEEADTKTEKKRQKRLRKKQYQRLKAKQKKGTTKQASDDEEDETKPVEATDVTENEPKPSTSGSTESPSDPSTVATKED